MRLALHKNLISHVLVGVLALSIGATVTVAAGVAGGVITACENLATGVLRVETTNAQCFVSGSPILARAPLLLEERITWNQVGSQGAAGPQGPTGPQGANGPKGADGDAGTAGAMGPTGAQGQKGDTGPAGAPGTAASLDNLRGTPCNNGTSLPGTLQVTYSGAGTYLSVSIQCKTSLVQLSATLLYTCGTNGCVTGSLTTSPQLTGSCHASLSLGECLWSVPQGTTVTLTPAPGTGVTAGWAGANSPCTGTGSCTLTLYYDTNLTVAFQ